MISLLNKSPKILVIGDLMIDHYLWGSSERVSPEAPVQIVDIDHESFLLGGAGNVVSNLKTLGAEVGVISILGKCETSNQIKNLLNNINVSLKYLHIEKDRIASKKSRIISSQQQVVRFDRESTNEIITNSQNFIINTFKKIIHDYEVILLSDYGKGLLTSKLSQSIITTAKKYGKKVLIDPKGRDYSKYKGAYLLTPNKKEASLATNIDITNDENLIQAISQLKIDCELDVSLITLSEQGVAIYDDEFRIHPTIAREVYDVTGAGDTIIASIGFALACNFNIDKAVKFSNLAAGVVVGKIGNATSTINEIIEYESGIKGTSSHNKIKTLNQIINLTSKLKTQGEKIIFTNGCFDILHSGHVQYLEEAKALGDLLILGLNSDKSVKRLKGKLRPINNQMDRAHILAALEVVDYVIIFDEDTPFDLINAIKPDILVKGGDYKIKDIVGWKIAKETKIIKFIDDKSTTKIINKIKKN